MTSRRGNPRSPQRAYYYFVDIHGRLFLEDTWPRTIATCLKDEKFLNFFFSNLVANSVESSDRSRYPFVSPCGKEVNFVSCADTPIVFNRLHQGLLCFGGSLSVEFSPQNLRVSKEGRLYHPSPVGQMGLVSTALLQEIMVHSTVDADGTTTLNLPGYSPITLQLLEDKDASLLVESDGLPQGMAFA